MRKDNILNNFVNMIIAILGYTLVIFLTDLLFDTLYSENIIYDLLASIIIMILEKTIKPILFKATIPITAITFGLFYPFINLILLKIADFILGSKFDIYGIFWGFFVAIMISLMNLFLNKIIIEPIIDRSKQ